MLSPTHFVSNIRHQHRCSQNIFHLALWHNPSSTSATVTPRVCNTARPADASSAAYLNHLAVQDLLLLSQTNHFGRSQMEEFRFSLKLDSFLRGKFSNDFWYRSWWQKNCHQNLRYDSYHMKYANVDQVVNAVLVTILVIGCNRLRNIWLLQ